MTIPSGYQVTIFGWDSSGVYGSEVISGLSFEEAQSEIDMAKIDLGESFDRFQVLLFHTGVPDMTKEFS